MTRARRMQCLVSTALSTALCLSLADLAHAQCPAIPASVNDTTGPAGAPPPIARPSPNVTRVAVAPAGTNSPGYCLYRPPSVTSFSDTLIVYIHGAQFGLNNAVPENGALDPMLQTLASLGFHVLYPDVASVLTPFALPVIPLPDWPLQTRNAMTRALNQLSNQGSPIAHLVVSGFSLGARAAPRVAATWTGTPRIELVVAHDPAGKPLLDLAAAFFGGPAASGSQNFAVTGAETSSGVPPLAGVPSSTSLLVVQSNELAVSTDPSARDVFNNLPQIPRFRLLNGAPVPQKNFLRIRNDSSHGTPTQNLISFHESIGALPGPFRVQQTLVGPTEITQLTAIDTFGYLLPLVGSAFEVILGGTLLGYSPLCNERGTGTNNRCSSTRQMGVWTDGIPATTMLNAGDLCLFSEPGCVPLG